MRISDWSSDVCSSDLDRLLGDLAQRDHRIFIAIAIERQIGAARDLPRTPRGEQHEIEPVGDFVDAIFDRDARQDRKSVVEGKSVSVRVDLGGRRIIKKKIKTKTITAT